MVHMTLPYKPTTMTIVDDYLNNNLYGYYQIANNHYILLITNHQTSN